MTVEALLTELRAKDARLWVAGTSLRYSAPPHVMTPDLIERIRAHKQELMARLPAPQAVRQTPIAAHSGSPLVKIQANGRELPLLCPAPSGGTVYCYFDLARRLGPEQPIWAFQTIGLDPGQPFLGSVEEIASHYLECVDREQFKGPFTLFGWSFGGIVAFEMARQLSARGQRPRLIAMVDTPTPERMPQGIEDDVPLLAALMRLAVPIHPDELRKVGSSRAQLQHLLELGKEAGVYQGELDLDQLCHFLSVHRSNNAVARKYAARSTDIPIKFFRPRGEDESGFLRSPDDPALGWRQYCAHVDVRFVPGNHLTILESPNIDVLASELQSCLGEHR